MAKQIKLQYQVKRLLHEGYEVKELTHSCDPSKSDKENLDDAYSKACELGCDPRKNIGVKFIEE